MEFRKIFSHRKISIILLTILIVISLYKVFALVNQNKTIDAIQWAYRVNSNASLMQIASDELTSNVKSYVITKKEKYLNDFYNEINVKKRRENAIQELYSIPYIEEVIPLLKDALLISNFLIVIEEKAIGLVAEGKFEEAKDLIFSEEYDLYKQNIYEKSEKFRERAITILGERVSIIGGNVENSKIIINIVIVVSSLFVVIIAIFFYLSEQRLIRANEDIEKQLKFRRKFLSNISHEFFTPLNGILNLSKTLLEESDNPKFDKKDYIKKINFSTNYLNQIAEQIFQYSQFENNKKINLQVKPFNYVSMLKGVEKLALINIEMQNKNEAIELKFIHNLHPNDCFFGDEYYLKQIIFNLLYNAITHTEKGEVKLSIDYDYVNDKRVLFYIEISDSGSGMLKEDLEETVEVLDQLEIDKVNRNKGLSHNVIKSFIDLMDGDFSFKSEEGKGTKFFVSLELDVAPCSEKKELDISLLKDKNILLVEDNEINTIVAQNVILNAPVNLDTAENGLLAYEAVQKKKYDLIFMDIQMPVMDGLEATTKIKALEGEYFKELPIVALTAHNFKEEREATEEAGMVRHLTKPINSDLIMETLCELLT